jgi:2-amino-4-hydroxy-6-hydroxymethyldihydropteridine diphosphokinase
VRYERWAPQYERIRTEFGFPFAAEEAAFRRLKELLPPPAREDALGRIGARLRGRDAIVVGLGPNAGPPPVWRLPAADRAPALIAADGATATCLAAGLVPEVVTTDLDGPIPAEVAANRRGSLVVVHAHGDNGTAVEEWVPQFPGPLAGSWAGPPQDGILDVGGFTDGDRGAYLADEVGAARILLWGFDFHSVEEVDPVARARKRAKLTWAERLLGTLAAEGSTPLFRWRRDGVLEPYPAGTSGPSTR